ncbi:SRPBCC family protein [Agromyces salentinus]|uniref:SRPBCC family protein n=1 Tax=Agromyces salentinus TaxID=269421 RepID=A0ABN2MIS0_9MICO|nr:SRPBCC family protein [Agromyces salentinus]
MARAGIYVETTIAASLDRVWHLSQDPTEHARWDLRFTAIVADPPSEDGVQRFTYTRGVPFHTVHGVGASLGESGRPDGTRTSALRFSTDDPMSPIRAGRGYWRYLPDVTRTRFITGYDYDPGWGPLDMLVRPVLGWATAWSFDRLRIWIERGEAPERWPLRSVLWFWRADRPRAARCRRAPEGGRRRADHLVAAPRMLATLPEPGADS